MSALLLGVWRAADGTFAGQEPVGLFVDTQAALEYVRSVRVDARPRTSPPFQPGTLLGSFDDYFVEDLTDVPLR